MPGTSKENIVYGVLALNDEKVGVVKSVYDKDINKIKFKADKFSNYEIYAY